MQLSESPLHRKRPAGFTLPAILVVVGALLILAVGILLVAGIERNTARSFADRERANLAARAGLDEMKGILDKEAANDDFLVIQGTVPRDPSSTSKKKSIPYLYLARGSGGGDSLKYRYLPLFSTAVLPESPAAGSLLVPPKAEALIGDSKKEISTLPWYDPAQVSWILIKDSAGKPVSRYAYWVEDLQGKIDGHVSGNVDGVAGLPARAKFPDPSARPVVTNSPPLSAIAVHVLDPESKDEPASPGPGKSLTQQIIDGRPTMLSPDSIIGATDILGTAALSRDESTGLLTDTTVSAMELGMSPVNLPYLEQPVVPFAEGLSEQATGKPKLNLNKLLGGSRSDAVDKFADWVDQALPDFSNKPNKPGRQGGFPENYLKTLAAGAFDYADEDGDPTVKEGSYIGLDSYPLLSEIVVHLDFLARAKVKGRDVLQWRIKLFAELWNMTNKEVKDGSAQLSYEVNLQPEPTGGGGETFPFDDPSILGNIQKSQHDLVKIGGKYYSPVISGISLKPDEYRFYEFATVNYTLDYKPQFDAKGKMTNDSFDLIEQELEARGITLRWNQQPVQVLKGIVRDSYGVENFMTDTPRKAAKAAIPGHSYGPFGFFKNNMGDPRIASYLRTTRLGENAYPENISPDRRNIRRKSIYDLDKKSDKRWHFGRVLPSEWPDGGHDSPVGVFSYYTDNAILPTDSTKYPSSSKPIPQAENAPQRISNLGRFYSATELGRIYDPILWKPVYSNLPNIANSGAEDTELLLKEVNIKEKPEMPPRRRAWPEVTSASISSTDYGGGNTLRIGRPEHGMFDKPGKRAARLLDLFHVGIPDSTDATEREGELIRIKGNINVNTAGMDALRAMAAGMLQQDPELRRVTNWDHEALNTGLYRPTTVELKLGTPTTTLVADRIADAIILRRPFASASQMASILDIDNKSVFGNRDQYTEFKDIQWSDAAAEELFSRVYDASTVRSRNFRVWVIGQALAGTEANPQVLAEARKVFTVFVDPGKRKTDGTIDPLKINPRVTYESDF